jgi:hypothetical protein
VLMLAASFIVFIAVGNAKSVQTSGHQLPTVVLTDGGGPMCIPDSLCGWADKTSFRSILLADGPGPMCPPTSGCGNGNITAEKGTQVHAEILLADGPGPMCPPRTGCRYTQERQEFLR